MSIIARELSTKFFTFSKTSGNLVAEASDLPEQFNFLGPIYDDAADAGFYLVSEKTGDKLLFSFTHGDLSPEGEVNGWWFSVVSSPLSEKKSNLKNIKLLIIND
jgi:hypothetical protein